MFTTRTMQDRLTRIYNGANADARNAADWYKDVAARDCEAISRETGVPFKHVAATMAVLSPGPQYSVNVADTRRMCQWAADGGYSGPADSNPLPSVSTYGPNRIKAAAILDSWVLFGEDADPAEHVSGPKVTAFFRNIIGELQHVTLDRHAVRPISKEGKDTPRNKTERARMEDAYRRAAAKVGLHPAEFQAVVWVAVRGAAE